MNKYQKSAALVIRLASLALILYTALATIPAIFMMPQAVWVMLPSFVVGVIIFIFAIPLGRIAASGIDE